MGQRIFWPRERPAFSSMAVSIDEAGRKPLAEAAAASAKSSRGGRRQGRDSRRAVSDPYFAALRVHNGNMGRPWIFHHRRFWSRRPAIPKLPVGSNELGVEGPPATENCCSIVAGSNPFRCMVVESVRARQQILQNTINGLWRKGWDSNPRYPCGHAGFQDRCLKPLGHPSGPGAVVMGEAGSRPPASGCDGVRCACLGWIAWRGQRLA